MFLSPTQRGRYFLILFSRSRQPDFVVEQAVLKPQDPSKKQHPMNSFSSCLSLPSTQNRQVGKSTAWMELLSSKVADLFLLI